MDASASSEATICELEAHGSPDPDASAVTECELEDLDTTITELTPECTSTPIPRSSKSRIRGVAEYSPMEVIQSRCCEKECVHQLSLVDIEKSRSEFYVRNETEQAQFVIDYLQQHTKSTATGPQTIFIIAGKEVCRLCWRMAMGIKRTRFTTLMDKFMAGIVHVEHGRSGFRYPQGPSSTAISWMRSFFDKVGDRMPMQQSFHLPSCLTKKEVYHIAKEDLQALGLECCSKTTFFEYWKMEFPNVVIPKEDRFTHCDICSAVKEARSRTTDPQTRQWLSKILHEHLDLQRREREKYEKHRRKAQKHPETYFSLIIDGMDQSKTNLPHITTNPKLLAGCHTLGTHVTGVKVHGRDTHIYIDFGELPHDSNLTMNVLLLTLLKYKDQLPSTLYLQMDNCARENKNKIVLTFGALLVELGVFRKVKFGFLPVGHTHEDIDQVFSRISTRLQHVNALTLPDLESTIASAYTPSPTVSCITYVWDIHTWLKPHIPQLHDHLKAHHFKIVMTEVGTRMFYKEWSSDDFWLPEDGLALLMENNEQLFPLLTTLPPIIKTFIKPDDISGIQTMVQKLSGYLRKGGHHNWWESWLHNQTEGDSEPLPTNWVLQTLRRNSSPIPTPRPKSTFQDHATESDDTHEQELPHIGYISTRWVGQRGKANLMNAARIETNHTIIQKAKEDLLHLAKSCLQGFKAAGVLDSQDPSIASAVRECQLLCRSKTEQSKEESPITSRWLRFDEPQQPTTSQSGKEKAISILGEEMVETIAKPSNPPDIYIGSLRGKTAIVHNREIGKELKSGSIVAVNHPSWVGTIPQIAQVVSVPSEPSLDTQVEIQWFEEERAPHKPRRRRCYTQSTKYANSYITLRNILLYDIELNRTGTLKKVTWNELEKIYSELKEGDWKQR